jgi:hypothetical protein
VVCLRNINVDTLHKGDTEDDNNNNNNNNNNKWITLQGRRGVVRNTEISVKCKYTTKERPIQADVPCFRRKLAFRPDQTRMLNELKGDYRYNCAPLNEEAQFPCLESLTPFSRELRMLGF